MYKLGSKSSNHQYPSNPPEEEKTTEDRSNTVKAMSCEKTPQVFHIELKKELVKCVIIIVGKRLSSSFI